MKPFVLAALASLAGCQSGTDGSRFHLRPATEAEGRSQARQIQASLTRFGPMTIYDDRNGSLNVALTFAASNQQVRTELEKVGLRPAAGLFRPSAGFLARVACGIHVPCETSRLTRCTFTTIVSADENDRLGRGFSERLFYSGYPVLGVGYTVAEDGRIVLSVPLYDQCDRGGRQLEQVWGEVANGDRKTFRVLRGGGR